MSSSTLVHRSVTGTSVRILILALALSVLVGVAPPAAEASTGPVRLGLHVTDVELDAWRARATTGPYRRAGDAGTNSPGDWDRIVSNRADFLASPASFRWAGPADPGGCIDFPGGIQYDPPVATSRGLRDAAFHAMVTDDAATRRTVAQSLVAQARVSNLDFSNRARWCLDVIDDLNPGFEIANWLTSLLYAVEYVEIGDRLGGTASFTAADRQVVLDWMYHAAEFMNFDTNKSLRSIFPDRDQKAAPPYTLSSTLQENAYYEKTPYDGAGLTIGGIARYYNNRNAAKQRFVGLLGLHLSQRTDGYVAPTGQQGYTAASYVRDASKFARDFLVYSTYPAGYVGEFERWKTELPDLGWAYAGQALAPILTYVDALARTGDRSLYDFTTSAGVHNTEGTPAGTSGKNWRWAVNQFVSFRTTQVRYIPGHGGDANYRIDGTHGSWQSIHEVMFAPFNRYWQDGALEDILLRTTSAVPAYPSSPASVGQYSVWNGDWGTLPATMFMTAQMPAGTSPYDATAPAPEPIVEEEETVLEPAPKAKNPRRPKALVADYSLACPGFTTETAFEDVAGSVHLEAIACLADAGIATGTTPTTFSPHASVSRGQLAAFVTRLLEVARPELASLVPSDPFSDDDGNPHERSINVLAHLGILDGTGQGRFSPAAPVQRAQAASILVAASSYLGGTPPVDAVDYFADDDGTVHEAAINDAAALGMVSGTGGELYAPTGAVSRGQMATMLTRLASVNGVSLTGVA
ncbi:MAG: S-layer homology domain-containing protein [Actinobacteria bacterium]|nr:S-layer homology domain-containing protein [Actinomycetota bacterium]